MSQLPLVPDERNDIPEYVTLDGETLSRWAAHRYAQIDANGEGNEAGWDTLAEVVDALAVFGGTHGQKKRKTILALVEAEMAGKAEETVWKQEDTCNRSTYHGKWKKNKQFSRTLALVRDAARKYASAPGSMAMLDARNRMQRITSKASRTIEKSLESADETIALRAALKTIEIAGVMESDSAKISDRTFAGAVTAGRGEGGEMTLAEWRIQSAKQERQAGEAEVLLDLFEEADADADVQASSV